MDIFMDNEEKKCIKCNSLNMQKLISVPLKAKNLETTDKYHDVKCEIGLQDDLKKRSRKHVNDILDQLIDEHGENIAKEQGWLISDDGGKSWRKRNDFDTKTLKSDNCGTPKPEVKK